MSDILTMLSDLFISYIRFLSNWDIFPNFSVLYFLCLIAVLGAVFEILFTSLLNNSSPKPDKKSKKGDN